MQFKPTQWYITWNKAQHIDPKYGRKVKRNVGGIWEIDAPFVGLIKQWNSKQHDDTCNRTNIDTVTTLMIIPATEQT